MFNKLKMGANKKLKNASTDKGSKPADASDIKVR